VCWKPCSSCWSFHLLREKFLSAPIHSPLSGSPYRSFKDPVQDAPLLEIREKVPEGQAPSPSLAAFNKSFGTSHRGELLSVGFELASIGDGASKILTL
jgi:hypothetical protein